MLRNQLSSPVLERPPVSFRRAPFFGADDACRLELSGLPALPPIGRAFVPCFDGRRGRPALPPFMSELLGESDENTFGAADVAEPIEDLVLHHFAHELRAMLAEPGERVVEVVHSEHDA